MNKETHKTGRPPLPPDACADSQIQLRVTRRRKAAYVRTASAQGKTLAAWAFEQLDAASGYEENKNG